MFRIETWPPRQFPPKRKLLLPALDGRAELLHARIGVVADFVEDAHAA